MGPALLLAACATGAPTPIRYTGPAPSCGRTEGGGDTATLTRLGGGFSFAPYDGSLVITGRVAADGTLGGTTELHPARAPASGGTGKPASRGAQTLSVGGRITPDAARFAYAAPGCSATVTLARVRPSVF